MVLGGKPLGLVRPIINLPLNYCEYSPNATIGIVLATGDYQGVLERPCHIQNALPVVWERGHRRGASLSDSLFDYLPCAQSASRPIQRLTCGAWALSCTSCSWGGHRSRA